MSSRQLDEEAIFHVARGIEDAELRATYLEQVCAGDQALRERVEALLVIHEQEQSFLASDPATPPPTEDHTPLTERPGTTIGRYKLMEQIGEGGMGTVFVAEQDRPIRRKVALKVVKPGMDSKAVVARFEAERQALAMMDHPNIAKVLDAGTTDSGRPFFAMELVKGIPITEYCDQNKLTISQRLRLFIQVCQAIQHAHQNAIIHRDIKPSNVLVTEQDGQPVPKVIDFGVAKALNQRLTDRTLYTSFQAIVGTPLYMSPEQAALSNVDVDTRSDVYSLGVLLYELLTGTTPFGKSQFDPVAYDEIRRVIREVDPPKPSTRISRLGDTVTAVSACRNTEPRKLEQLVHGDLDWISMRSLEKDRARRYDSASDLADDVRRFLTNHPVDARPPSFRYQLWKYVQRHKVAAFAAALIGISLLAGLVGTTSGWLAEARTRKQLNATVQKLTELLIDKGLVAAVSGDDEATKRAIDDIAATGRAGSWADILEGLRSAYAGQTAEAVSLLTDAAARSPDDMTASALLGWAHHLLGNVDEFADELFKIKDMRPVTDYDHLFSAYVRVQGDGSHHVGPIQQVCERNPGWSYARVILADALAFRALDSDTFEDITQALQEMEIAEQKTGDHPMTLATHLYIYTAAIALRERLDLPLGEWQVKASELATKLESLYPDYAYGRMTLGRFYAATNEVKRAEQQFREANKLGTGEFGNYFLAAMQARRGVIPETPTTFGGALLAGKERALEYFDSFDGTEPTVIRVWSPYLEYVYGDKAAARASWKRIAESIEPKPWWISMALNSHMNKRSPYQLLVEAGESNEKKMLAHFCIAMKHLANSNPKAAASEFECCIACDMVTSEVPHFARAYLERLEDEDQDWPDWLADQHE